MQEPIVNPEIHREFPEQFLVPTPSVSKDLMLDAKRHYVIRAKALDGIWPVGHACAVLC